MGATRDRVLHEAGEVAARRRRAHRSPRRGRRAEREPRCSSMVSAGASEVEAPRRLPARAADDGAYAERVLGKEDAWAAVPESLDLADAAAVPLVALTGGELVDEGVASAGRRRGARDGRPRSVGRVAVFVAKARGARVWAGVRGAQKATAAALEVEGVLALDDDADLRRLPTLDGIADTVGGAPVQNVLAHVRQGGAVGTVLGEPPGARERGLEVRHVLAHPDPQRLAAMLRAVAEGSLVIPIARRFPLSEIREAQTLAEKGAGGKVLLRA